MTKYCLRLHPKMPAGRSEPGLFAVCFLYTSCSEKISSSLNPYETLCCVNCSRFPRCRLQLQISLSTHQSQKIMKIFRITSLVLTSTKMKTRTTGTMLISHWSCKGPRISNLKSTRSLGFLRSTLVMKLNRKGLESNAKLL